MKGTDRSGLGARAGRTTVEIASNDRIRNRRRSILVHRTFQLRIAALVGTVVLVLLVFLNLSLYSASAGRSEAMIAEFPELTDYVRTQDRVLVLLVVLGSSVFLIGVFVVSLLETHKTAGACVNLARRLADVERGTYGIELRLRRDDHLRELEGPFNRMCQALQQRVWEDVEALEALASRIERSDGAIELAEISGELRSLARRARERIE